jgi:Ni/Co efflux regulator RcnB
MRAGGEPGAGRMSGLHEAPGFLPGGRRSFSTAQRYSYRGHMFAAVRAPAYRFARGYQYRRFMTGERFPAFLLINQYFIMDYYLYNLAPPPPGFVWVRFGPDILLVNTYTGEVGDTTPGVFEESQDGPPPDYQAPADAALGSDTPQPAPQVDGDGTPYPGPNGYPAQPVP